MKLPDFTKKYALAVSGGSDSMAMLHMFVTHRPTLNFFVVTVNHCLRKAGPSDASFVEDYCQKHNVQCLRFDVDVPAICKAEKLSVETAARQARYQVFETLDCDYVCLAHNKDDNAESVLMHILRGCGTHGVIGMRYQKGRYVRPVLHYTKQYLDDYCNHNGVPYVTDETNFDLNMMRNYVRHEIVPRLKNINSNAVNNVLRCSENIKEDDDYLNSLACIDEVTFNQYSFSIPLHLLAQPKPIAYRVLRKAFIRAGYESNVEKFHYDNMLALANGFGGRRLSLPFDLVAVNDYDKLTVISNSYYDSIAQCVLHPVTVGATPTPYGTVNLSQTQPDQPCLQIDLDKLPPTAVIRTPQQGDVFTKFGGGTKPLVRYLIDKKVPQRQRNKLLLVADGNNVLVVCGVEIADAVKIDQNTKNKYYLYLT